MSNGVRQAASAWASGKGFSLHGSVFGGCVHAQVLALQGVEVEAPPSYMQKLFDAGHESEELTKQWLRHRGVTVKDKRDGAAPGSNAYDDQIELKKFYEARDGKGILLSLHLDGVVKGAAAALAGEHWVPTGTDVAAMGELNVWENKALSPEKFEKFCTGGIDPAVFPRYAWQTSAQLVFAREHLAGKGIPSDSLGLIVSAERRDYNSDTRTYHLSGVRAFQFHREPIYSAGDIEARCQHIVHCFYDGIVPDCDSEYPCDYAKQKREATERDVDPVTKAQLNAYLHSQGEQAYHAAKLVELKPTLMTALGVGLWRIGDVSADVRVDKRQRQFLTVKRVEAQ